MARLQLNRETTDNRTTIGLVGELDAHTAPDLEDAMGGDGASNVTLDLSQLTFVDSTGLRVIVAQHRKAEENGGALTLQGPSDSVKRTLEYAGLTEHLNIEN